MNPVVLAAAIQAGSSLMTNISNVALSERQRNTSMEMMDKMNQYNSPEEQVKRMRAAGLNPNLSNGQVIGANQSAPYQGYNLPQLRDLMSDASNSALTMAQAKTEDAMRTVRVEQAQADIDNLKANAAKLGVDAQYQSIINSFAAARESWALEEQKTNVRIGWSTVKKLNQEAKNLAKVYEEVMPAEIYKTLADANVSVFRIDEILAHIANMQKEGQKIEQDIATGQAQEALLQSQTEGQDIENKNAQPIADLVMENYNKTIDKIAAETGRTRQQTEIDIFEAQDRFGSISFLGTRIPAARFGEFSKEYRDYFGEKTGGAHRVFNAEGRPTTYH